MSTYVDQDGRARVPAGTVALTNEEAAFPQGVTAVGGRYAVAPGLLQVRDNIRRNLWVDEAFVESVRALGVVKDIDVYARPNGLVVLDGHRRLAAALEAGVQMVPVRVVHEPRQADRIGLQLLSNDAGRHNRSVERADAITQMVLLGASAGDLRAHGVRRFEQVAAKKVSAASGAVRDLEAQAGLDMVALAAVAELEESTSPAFAAEIAALIEGSPEMIDHILQYAESDFEEWEAVQRLIAEARATGARILSTADEASEADAQYLYWLRDAETGEPISHEEHMSCPGRALLVRGGAELRVPTFVEEMCCDPESHGHGDFRTASRSSAARAEQQGKSEEELRAEVERKRAAEERRRAVEAAHRVRRTWVRQHVLGCARVPADAALLIDPILRELDDYEVVEDSGRRLITEAGGTCLRAAPPGSARAAARSVLAWAVAQAEGLIGVGEIHQSRALRTYLRSLERWGYALSPVEQEYCEVAEADDAILFTLPKERAL